MQFVPIERPALADPEAANLDTIFLGYPRPEVICPGRKVRGTCGQELNRIAILQERGPLPTVGFRPADHATVPPG